jgi:hypothetical protein
MRDSRASQLPTTRRKDEHPRQSRRCNPLQASARSSGNLHAIGLCMFVDKKRVQQHRETKVSWFPSIEFSISIVRHRKSRLPFLMGSIRVVPNGVEPPNAHLKIMFPVPCRETSITLFLMCPASITLFLMCQARLETTK